MRWNALRVTAGFCADEVEVVLERAGPVLLAEGLEVQRLLGLEDDRFPGGHGGTSGPPR